jgi:hypothetical protein
MPLSCLNNAFSFAHSRYSRVLAAVILLSVSAVVFANSGCVAGDANGSEDVSQGDASSETPPQDCDPSRFISFEVDLDEDGQTDVIAWNEDLVSEQAVATYLYVCTRRCNRIVTDETGAAALEDGARIGDSLPSPLQWKIGGATMRSVTGSVERQWTRGPWKADKTRYLGVALASGGASPRYGWLRSNATRSILNAASPFAPGSDRSFL